MQDVIGAKWGRPMMRLHESFSSFLPFAAGLLAVFFACIALNIGHAKDVYVWIKDPSFIAEFWGKRDWLKPGLMMGRDLFALAVILGLARWQLKQKLGRDQAFMKGDHASADRLGREAVGQLRHWSAPILVCYALCFSLLAFDITMSLSPKWFSTLWAAWSFAVMMQSLMATLLITMYIVRSKPIGQFLKRQQFHDIGKMMHGFTIFFAYLTYAHILTYWYGNMPEETEYFIHRLHGPWVPLLWTAFIMVFIFPLFALLPKASKWTAGLAIPIASSILIAQWIVALLVVIPETADAHHWGVPWIELGIFLGFLGLFLLAIFQFGKKYPMVAVGDPLLHEALADAHH